MNNLNKILKNVEKVELIYKDNHKLSINKESISIKNFKYNLNLNEKSDFKISLNINLENLLSNIEIFNEYNRDIKSFFYENNLKLMKKRLCFYRNIEEIILVFEDKRIAFKVHTDELLEKNDYQFNSLKDNIVNILIDSNKEFNENKTYEVLSKNTNKVYLLKILKVKNKKEYKIYNLTNNYLSDCTFSSYEGAERDIYEYEYLEKNVILNIKY